jgi:hypothetical protein
MTLNEVSPPGWGHTKAEKEKTKPNKPKSKIGGSAAAFKRALDDGRFKGLPGSKTKKEKTADMFKLMWSMKKKGDKPHYKPGTDKKYKKYQESLSVKDSKKLNKASALSQSNNPKDQDRARARQVEVDYKDLMRQIKAKKKMRSEEASYKQRDKELKKAKKAMDFRHKTIHKGGDDDVNESTSIIRGNTSSKKVSYRGPTADNKRDKDGNIVASHYGKREDKRTDSQKKKHSDAVRKFDNYQKLKDKVTAKDAARKKHNQEYHASKKKENDEKSVRNNQRPTFKRIKEATTMKDNNLFGNAYAGSYETLKKKIGSKKKHDKPAIKEGVSYKDFMRNVYIEN